MKTIWILAKPGEDRFFCSPRQYNPQFVEIQRKNGYRLLKLQFRLPNYFEPQSEELTPSVAMEELND
jgi:hypothetical protein